MASRDDSVLYTGMSSASFARVSQKKAQIKEAKTETKGALEKNAHAVLSRLDKEIEAIPTRIFDLVDIKDTEATYKSTLIALKMYESYLTSLKGEFVHILGLKGDRNE